MRQEERVSEETVKALMKYISDHEQGNPHSLMKHAVADCMPIREAIAAIRAEAERERDEARALNAQLAEALRAAWPYLAHEASPEQIAATRQLLAAYDAPHEAAG